MERAVDELARQLSHVRIHEVAEDGRADRLSDRSRSKEKGGGSGESWWSLPLRPPFEVMADGHAVSGEQYLEAASTATSFPKMAASWLYWHGGAFSPASQAAGVANKGLGEA